MKEPVSLYDELVLPTLKGSHKSEVLLSATPHFEHFQHLRMISRRLRTCVTAVPTAELPAPQVFVERALYGGILWPHYSHFLAEGIHRLWPLWFGLVPRDCLIAFHRVAGAPVPPFVFDVLAFLGIRAENVMLIDQPTQFGELIIAKQAKMFGGRASDEYNASFKSMSGGEVRFDRVYVSRSRYLAKAFYLGESLLQSQLERAGFTIIYPEEWSLRDLVGIYRHASAIIFAEGGTLHVLEVTGGTPADVMIVNRRNIRYVECSFVDSIVPLCKRVLAFEHKAALTTMHWDAGKGQPSIGLASAYVDLQALLSAISGFFGIDVGQLDPVELVRALQADLAKSIFYAPFEGLPDETVGKLLKVLKKQVLDLGLLGSPSVVAALDVAATSPSTGSATPQAAALALLGGTRAPALVPSSDEPVCDAAPETQCDAAPETHTVYSRGRAVRGSQSRRSRMARKLEKWRRDPVGFWRDSWFYRWLG
jgi:hypothetical protein